MVKINTKPLAQAQPSYVYAEDAAGAIVKKSGRGWYNVLDYGPGKFDAAVHISQAAVDSITLGSNVAQSLSLVYLNLTAAQTRYPRALALTETFDWHCHQAAIDAARMDGGGVVYTPKGQYKMNASGKLAPAALKFPLMSEINAEPTISVGTGITDASARVPVSWCGDGELISRLYWDADAGSAANDNFAVQFGDIQGVDGTSGGTTNSRYMSGANSWGFMEHLGLIGPNTTTTIDTKGCNMSGIQFIGRRHISHCRIENFWAGIDIIGDHTPLNDLYINNCFYLIYFNYRSSTMYGDFSLGGKCMFTRARKACWGFHAGAWINNWHIWGRCFFGHSPYVFFKEPTSTAVFPTLTSGGSGTAKADWMAGCLLHAPFFENIGNMIICDDNYRASGTSLAYSQVKMEKATLSSWDNTYKITGHDRCFMQTGTLYGCQIDLTLYSMSGITKPFFNMVGSGAVNGGATFSGDLEGMGVAAAAAAIQLFGINEFNTNKVRLIHQHDNSGTSGWWEGRLQYAYGAITKGDYMMSKFNGVQASSDTLTTEICVGVARNAASVSGDHVMVAEIGSNIPVNTTGVVSGQQLYRIGSTAGKLQAATSITDGRVVGRSHGAGLIDLYRGGM